MVELEEGGFWEHLMAYTGGNKAETGELSGEVVGNLSTLSCVLEVRVFFFSPLHEKQSQNTQKKVNLFEFRERDIDINFNLLGYL